MKYLIFIVVLLSAINSNAQQIKVDTKKFTIDRHDISAQTTSLSIEKWFGTPDRIDTETNERIEFWVYEDMGLTFYFEKQGKMLKQMFIAYEPFAKNHLPKTVFQGELSINKLPISKNTSASFMEENFERFERFRHYARNYHSLAGFKGWDFAFSFMNKNGDGLDSVIVHFYR